MKKVQKANSYHSYINTDDYIDNPKESGYRSVHLVYKYHSDTIETYNKNMLIELKFRIYRQHIWATALEIIGLFTKKIFKSR